MPNQLSARQKNSSDWKPWDNDEITHEVYRNRDAYAAEHDYDLEKIYEDLKRREAHSSLKRAEDRK